MKKSIGLLLCALCCFTAWAKGGDGGKGGKGGEGGEGLKRAQLKIDIYEWGNDTVVVSCRPWSGVGVRLDTVVAREGRLTYQVAVVGPAVVVAAPIRSLVARRHAEGWYTPQSLSINTLMLPGSNQKITGWVDGWLEYKASGSDRYFADAARVRSLTLPYRATIDTIERRLITERKTEALYERRKKVYGLIDSVQLLFLKRSPSSPASGGLLGSARYSDLFFDYEKRLSPKVRGGVFKEQIDEMVVRQRRYQAALRGQETMVKGVEAVDFSLPDTSGVAHTLGALRGKWVVLDFWGSWCGWCTHGVPAMKQAYEKHRGRVEFVGIACNDQPIPWRAAIEQHTLPWINVFEERVDEHAVDATYGVTTFPTKIVVDPTGKIALYMQGEDPRFYTELDQLISKP